MDEFTVTAVVIIGAIVGTLGTAAVAKWQHRALWVATPVMLWPTNTVYVQAAVALLLILGTIIGSRRQLREVRKPFLLVVVFAAWMGVVFVLHGAPVLVDEVTARNHLLTMLLSVALVPIIALQRPPLIPTLKVIAVSAAVVSIYVLITYGEAAGRVQSATHNPNAVGLAAALGFLTAIAVAILTRKPVWLLAAVPTLLLFVGSQNRSGLIIIVVGAVLLWLLQRSGPLRLVAAIAVLVVAPFAVDIALEYQRVLFSERTTENFEVTAREAVLGLAIRLTIENPEFGVGYRHFIDYSASQLGMALNPHNDYARTAAEGGVLAILLLAGITLRVVTFRDSSRGGRILRAVSIAAALTLAFGNLITDFRVTWVLWVLLGMCWVSTRNPRQVEDTPRRERGHTTPPPSAPPLRLTWKT